MGIGGTLTGVAVEIRNLCAAPTNCFEPQVPLVVDVRRTIGGVPVEANSGIDILGTASIPWASTPYNADFSFTWVDFALDGFPVAPGDVLALVLRAPGSGGTQPFVWAGNHGLDWAPTPSTYAGGREYLRFFGGTWGDYPGQSSANGDFSFRVFVEPTPAPEPISTPEPGSLAVLGGMLALFAGRRWAGGGWGGQPGSSAAM